MLDGARQEIRDAFRKEEDYVGTRSLGHPGRTLRRAPDVPSDVPTEGPPDGLLDETSDGTPEGPTEGSPDALPDGTP